MESNRLSAKPRSDSCNPNEVYRFETPINKLYLLSFRAFACASDCSKADCFGFHSGQKQRRVPVPVKNKWGWNYLPTMCKNLENCRKGAHCRFAHTPEERAFHPLLFKVRLCRTQNPCYKRPLYPIYNGTPPPPLTKPPPT